MRDGAVCISMDDENAVRRRSLHLTRRQKQSRGQKKMYCVVSRTAFGPF
jgi:hypothetical protein